jgi:tetratricopeptide (TPR) repeat protein
MKTLIDLGLAAFNAGRYKAAEAHFSKAINTANLDSGETEMAHLFLARCLGDRGEIEGALGHYETALPLPAAFDDLWRYYNSEARDAFRAGQPAVALRYYDRSVSLAHLWLRLYGPKRSVTGGEGDAATTQLHAMREAGFQLYSEHLSGDVPEIERVFSKTDQKFIAKLVGPSHAASSEEKGPSGV